MPYSPGKYKAQSHMFTVAQCPRQAHERTKKSWESLWAKALRSYLQHVMIQLGNIGIQPDQPYYDIVGLYMVSVYPVPCFVSSFF